MASLDDLKAAIAAYLQKVPTDFVVGGTDLLLLAINNAKRWAQSQRDFEACRTRAQVTVSLASGVDISTAVLVGTNTAVDVKIIEEAYLQWADHGLKPILFVDRKTQSSDLGQRLKGWPFRQTLDTPPINPTSSLGLEDTPQLVQQSTTLSLWPSSNAAFGDATSMTVVLDIVQWMPDYTSHPTATVVAGDATYSGTYQALGSINGQTFYICPGARTALFWLSGVWYITDVANISTSVTPSTNYHLAAALVSNFSLISPVGTYATTGLTTTATVTLGGTNVGSDWFLVRGFEYLLWKSVVDGNYLWKNFVPRTEGNLSAPDALWQSAWENLKALDGALIGENTTAFTLD